MPYLVLARKLRPQRFQDLVGQESIYQTLKNALKTHRVAHAFLFTGPRGTGKTSCARILTKALNCTALVDLEPCNQCENCLEINQGISADVMEIDAASNRGIDHIRELRESVKFSPSKGRYKTYIIDEVHMLTTESFNALLKTLEEPPAHVKFILATTDPHKIPITVVSRCQRFDFGYIPTQKMADYLSEVAQREQIKISMASLQLISSAATGGMRDALTSLDMLVSFAGNEIDDESVATLLGLGGEKETEQLLAALVNRDLASAMELLNIQMRKGRSLDRLVSDLMTGFKDLSLIKELPPEKLGWRDFLGEQLALYQQLAKQCSTAQLQQMFHILIEAEQQMHRSSQGLICLEMAMVKLCKLERVQGIAEVLALLSGKQGIKKKVKSSPETDFIEPQGPGESSEQAEAEPHRREPTRPETAVTQQTTLSSPVTQTSPVPTALTTAQAQPGPTNDLEVPAGNEREHSNPTEFVEPVPPVGSLAPGNSAQPAQSQSPDGGPIAPVSNEPAVLETKRNDSVASSIDPSTTPPVAPGTLGVQAKQNDPTRGNPQASPPLSNDSDDEENLDQKPLELPVEAPQFVSSELWEIDQDEDQEYDPSPEEMGESKPSTEPVGSGDIGVLEEEQSAPSLDNLPESEPPAEATEFSDAGPSYEAPDLGEPPAWLRDEEQYGAPAEPQESAAPVLPVPSQPVAPVVEPEPQESQPPEAPVEVNPSPETPLWESVQTVSEGEGASWSSFVARFGEEAPLDLWALLKSCVALEFGPQKLQLGCFNPAVFSIEKQSLISRFATRFFGQTPKIDFVLSGQGQEKSLRAQELQQREVDLGDRRDRAAADPKVQAIRQAFPQSQIIEYPETSIKKDTDV